MNRQGANTIKLLILGWMALGLAIGCGSGGSGDGGSAAPAPEPAAQPARTAEATPQPDDEIVTLLEWRHSGGIAGICRNLTVQTDGSFTLVNCMNGGMVAEGILTSEQFSPLREAHKAHDSFEWSNTPPAGGADMFSMSLRFSGEGSGFLDSESQAEIAQQVYALVNELERASRL